MESVAILRTLWRHRLVVAVLGVLAVLRVRDLWARGVLPLAFQPTYEAALFQLEFLVGLLLPLALLAVPRVRSSPRGLYAASLLTVLGFITNRLNVSITGFEGAQGGHYIPAAAEVLVTLMLVALGFGAFNLAVRYLPVYPPAPAPPK